MATTQVLRSNGQRMTLIFESSHMTFASPPQREAIPETANPLGLDGIEFIEYTTAKPQALGQVLEMMGFKPVARHRSREVLLYRQGGINVIVNAHQGELAGTSAPGDKPRLAAIALRVRDAAAAYRRALERGAWAVPPKVEVMELNIPPAAFTLWTATTNSPFTTWTLCPSPAWTRTRPPWPVCIFLVWCST